MVTKQQQLEWLAKTHEEWPYIGPVMIMSDKSIGAYYGAPMPGCHFVSFTEWQRERDKMQKAETTIGDEVYSVLQERAKSDNSWHERGELPPVGCECEFNDSAWLFEDVSVTPADGDRLTICAKSKTPSGRDCVIFTWVSKNRALLAAAAANHSAFRPLRTERERAIDEMVEAAVKSETLSNYAITGDVLRVISERLCDAGYRKVKP